MDMIERFKSYVAHQYNFLRIRSPAKIAYMYLSESVMLNETQVTLQLFREYIAIDQDPQNRVEKVISSILIEGQLMTYQLIRKEYKPDFTYKGGILLLSAAHGRLNEIVDEIVDSGIDLSVLAINGGLTFFILIDFRFLEIVFKTYSEYLRQDFSPFLIRRAFEEKSYIHLSFLIKNGLDIHMNNDEVFSTLKFYDQLILIKYDPYYNWSKVDGYNVFVKKHEARTNFLVNRAIIFHYLMNNSVIFDSNLIWEIFRYCGTKI